MRTGAEIDTLTPVEVYLPPGIWREIGLTLLNANDLGTVHNLCLTCKVVHQALEPEFTDLFGKPLSHLAFRSRHIREYLCQPLVSELRRMLSEMRTSRHRTSMLITGGIGDIEQTLTHVVLEQENKLIRDDMLTQTVIMHCRNCKALQRLTKTRYDASHEMQMMQPLLLVLLGVDAEAWRNQLLISWAINHMCYNASVVFVSQSYVKAPSRVLTNMNKIMCIDGVRLSEVSAF